MESIVYLFSKFSVEFLLLEALVICALIAGYAAFYVLRKRRLGHVDQTVPSGVVKGYLTHLILEAEQMRAQLFGLLGGDTAQLAGVASLGSGADAKALLALLQAQGSMAGTGHSFAGGGAASDPQLLTKVQLLEGKMTEQAKAMQSVVTEKEKIEKELVALRTSGGSGGTAATEGGVSPSEMADLQEKLRTLEGKLAEYSIIEDDLANLKRLQQENAQLRAALAGQGGAPATTGAPVAPVPVAQTASTPEASEDALIVIDEAPAEIVAEEVRPGEAMEVVDPLAALTAADQSTAATTPVEASPAFEGLVDQVEQSLQPAAVSVPPPTETTPSTLEKTDADLVEEFEKMLNA